MNQELTKNIAQDDPVKDIMDKYQDIEIVSSRIGKQTKTIIVYKKEAVEAMLEDMKKYCTGASSTI